MFNKGNTVRITKDLEQAFRANGWDSYDPNTHGKIAGKVATITKIEAKYAHDYCFVDVQGVGAFSDFTLPVRALTLIELPSKEMCELIAEFCDEKLIDYSSIDEIVHATTAIPNPDDIKPEDVKQWFTDKLINNS